MGILLTTRLWPAAAVGAAALLALSACQTTGMKDSSGTNVQVSEWKVVDVSEVDLNLPQLLPQKITKIEHQVRDNILDHYRYQLDGGKGVVLTQYHWDAWYSTQTQQMVDDIEHFKKKVSNAFKGQLTRIGEIREIERKGRKTVGFATVADVKNAAKGKCFFSSAGYRLKGRTSYDNDHGNIDAFVEMIYCDPQVKIDDFSRALEEVKLVKSR